MDLAQKNRNHIFTHLIKQILIGIEVESILFTDTFLFIVFGIRTGFNLNNLEKNR